MSLENVEIRLDNPSLQYKPGQAVTGRVILLAKENDNADIVAADFTINFKGQADVSWYDSRMRCSSSEIYFEFTTVLASDEQIIVKRGVAESYYPFSFQLPTLLPSSFSGNHGNVLYIIKVLLMRPWKLDWHASTVIQVTTPLSLANIPNISLPSECQNYKNFDFLWFKRGTLYMKVRLPKRGFKTGEMIRFETEINNESKREVENLSASICQVAEYIGKNVSITETRVVYGTGSRTNPYVTYSSQRTLRNRFGNSDTTLVANTNSRKLFNEIRRGKGVSPEASDSWSADLQVPEVPPTTTVTGDGILIGLSYYVNVTASVNSLSWSNTLEASCPFTLGSATE